MAHGSSGLCCLKGALSSQEDHELEVGKEVGRPHPLLLTMSVPDLSPLKCSHPLPILLASHCLHCRYSLHPGPGPGPAHPLEEPVSSTLKLTMNS